MRKIFAVWLALSLTIWSISPVLPAQALESTFRQQNADSLEARTQVRTQLTGLEEEPFLVLIDALEQQNGTYRDAIANPQAYWLEILALSKIADVAALKTFLSDRGIAEGQFSDQDLQRIVDLTDNYEALHYIFNQNSGLTRQNVVNLIERQAEANNTSLISEVRGVLDVPDAQLPKPEEFDALLHRAQIVYNAGGNSGRSRRESARKAGIAAISKTPVWDDGGNYGTWRSFLKKLFSAFVVSLGGDLANTRTVETSLAIRQAMADRLPEKGKLGWEAGELVTVRDLLLREIKNAFDSYRVEHPEKDPTQEPTLVRSLATLVSAHRILTRAFGQEALMKTKVLSKASGQNVTGVAIAIRSGFLDLDSKQVNPQHLKRALLLWNRVLGLDGDAGLVIPDTLDEARDYFVYRDELEVTPVMEDGKVTAIRLAKAEIDPADYFRVTRGDNELVLTDGAGRKLQYDKAERAYVAREDGVVVNRFEEFPRQIHQAIWDRLEEVPVLSLGRGEDNWSEEDSIYDNTSVLAWGAEFRADHPPRMVDAARESYQSILEGSSSVERIVYGPGSEGTSTAPHFWVQGEVQFLQELAKRRKAGEAVPTVVFIFNPSETNDSYGLGPLGIIRNYELIFRQMLGDDSVRFEDLIPEVVLFDHTDPWVLKRNPLVAKEMGVSEEDVDYLRLLGPTKEEYDAGQRHGLIKKNRQPMPLDETTLATLRERFGVQNVHVGPYADVRGTVESSRGKVSRDARVLALTHRMWPVEFGPELFERKRQELLPIAVTEESRIYSEKNGERSPSPQELAGFLNKVGYNTTPEEVAIHMAGLEGKFALPVHVAEGSFVILTPETAQAGLEALALLQPPPFFSVIVNGSSQRSGVEARLGELGLKPVLITDLTEARKPLSEVELDHQVLGSARRLEVFILERLEQLSDLGRFLKIPALMEWLERVKSLISIERAA